MTNLAGKSAVVAAGAKNLGGLISTTLAEQGVNVAVHYNSAASEPDADKTVATVQAAGVNAIKVQGDLTKPANVTALFDAAVNAFGGVDIAINAVGKVLRKPIVDTSEAEYDSMFDINAKAAYFFLQQAGKRLNDGGSVITIVTALLAAFTDGLLHLRRCQEPGGTLHSRCGQRVCRARNFSEQRGAGTDAHAVLLRRGDTGARGVSQVAGDGQPADSYRGHRAAGGVPGRRRPLGDRPDHLRQRRLHHALRCVRPTAGCSCDVRAVPAPRPAPR